VTLEEGLVALLAGVAGILLFIGLAKALDARPAASAVRPRGRSSGRRITRAEPAPPRPERTQRFDSRPLPAPATWPVVGPQRSQPDLPLPSEGADAGVPPAADPMLDALEHALALQREGQHAQVVEVAVPHLEIGGPAEGAAPSFVQGALWTVVGVSRHALGDIEGAQDALETAVRLAPNGISEGCPRRIAAAAASSAGRLLAAADAMSATSGERVALLRMTVLWLEWRIVSAPATEEVSVLLDRARDALWDGYLMTGRGLMRRRQFAKAHELVRDALDSEDLPAARRAPLAELSVLSVVRQIGRLASTARGTETPKAGALDALDRAKEILATHSVEDITPRRWHDANRRIWNGYTRLGQRDIEGFELEAALRPLFSALHLRDLDPGLERRSRVLLARTIERISDGAGETIGRLLEEGDHDAALQRWQNLRGIIQKARDGGLSHEELVHAFARAQQMLEQIEAAKG
jgi:hypothetical protein